MSTYDLREQQLAAWTERRDGETRAMRAVRKPAPIYWCQWGNVTLGGPSADRVLNAAVREFPSWAGFEPEWHANGDNPHDGGFGVAKLVKGRMSHWGREAVIRIVVDQPPTEGSGFRVLLVEEVARG